MRRSRAMFAGWLAFAALSLFAPAALAQPATPATGEPTSAGTETAQPEPTAPATGSEVAEELATFGPQEYKKPWTWYLGVLLSLSAAFAVFATAAGYYFLVVRPASKRTT